MSSPTTKTTQFKIIFVLYSLLLGLLIGGIAAAFLALINFSTHLIWQVGYSHFNQPFYPLLVGLFGGLLVGLMQRYWGLILKQCMKHSANLNKPGPLPTNSKSVKTLSPP